MKIVAYIFCLLVLALSATPCGDVSGSCGSIPSAQAETHSPDTTDHHDPCTPFCVCNCCQSPAAQHLFSAETTAFQPAESALTFPTRNPSFVSNYYGNIWQPPKNQKLRS